MRYLFGFLCVCALGLVPLVGCSDTTGDGGNGGAGGTGGTGGSGGVDPSPVTLSLTLLEGSVQADVEICETDTDNCTLTDADGRATIDLVPADGRISYTVGKDGYATLLFTDVVDEEFTGQQNTFVVSNERVEGIYDAAMMPYPPPEGTGGATVLISTDGAGPLAGATLEIVGSSIRPFYRAQGVPDPDLTSTVGPSTDFFEVPPGEVEIRLGGTATNCTPLSAWPGSEANTIRMLIRAGAASYSTVRCDAP